MTDLVIAKEHVSGKTFRAVVMRAGTNEIVWRNNAVGWTKERKAEAQAWIDSQRCEDGVCGTGDDWPNCSADCVCACHDEGTEEIIYPADAYEEEKPHEGHVLPFTGAWYCDTCDSPYCDLA